MTIRFYLQCFPVTWGRNASDPYLFADVPRTVVDATADNWALLSSCGDNSSKISTYKSHMDCDT